MASDKPWEKRPRTKVWQEMNADEKAECLREELKQVNSLNAKLERMRNLYAMLSDPGRKSGEDDPKKARRKSVSRWVSIDYCAFLIPSYPISLANSSQR